MGQTLANLGPQLGQAGQGFIQGRQMATQEDQSRQQMALRAAQEGRAKEEHRLSIQQLGLAIQEQERAKRMHEQIDPMRVRGDRDAQVAPDYEKALGWEPGSLGNLTTREAENASMMNVRETVANKPRAPRSGADPQVEGLRKRAELAEKVAQHAMTAEKEAGDMVADLHRRRNAARRKEEKISLDEQIVEAEKRKRDAQKERKGVSSRALDAANAYSRALGADEYTPSPYEGEEEEEENEFR